MSYAFNIMEEEGIRCLRLEKEGEIVMEILPDHGATLNRLMIEIDGELREVIAGYEGYGEVPEFPGSRSAILFPFPNRLKAGKYRYEGVEYQFPTEEKHQGNAIHGMVRKEPFKLEEYEATAEGGVCKVVYYSSGLPYYPFPFGLQVEFQYTADKMITKFNVENRGNTHMPVGLGWHPYFTLGQPVDGLELKLPFVSQVVLDEVNLPTGQVADFFDYENFEGVGDKEFDDCFKLIMQDKSAIFSPEKGYGLALEPSKEFLFLQVYTPGDRSSIAIEPMNCNVNAFNNQEGLMDLEKGSFYHADFTIRGLTKGEYEEIKADFEED